MATPNEVELLIRARNQASKTLAQVGDEIADLVKSQKALADVNVLAGKSQAELKAQSERLLATLTNLSKLLNDVRAYRAAQQASDELSKKLAEQQAVYAGLKTKIEGVEKPTRKLQSEMRKAGAEVSTTQKAIERTGTTLAKLGGALNEAGVELNDMAAAEKRVVDLAGQTARAYDVSTQALRDQATAVELVKQAEVQEAQQQAKSRAAIEATNKTIRENIAVMDQRRARLKQAVEVFSNASDSDLRNAGSRGALQADLDALKAAQLRGEAEIRIARINQRADIVEQRLAATRRNLAGATDQAAAATNRAARAQTVYVNSGKTALSIYQRVRGQVLAMASAYVGLFGAINLARGSIDAAISREAINARLIAASGGDAKAAASEYKFLREEADRLGVNFENAASAYSRFAIAARGAGQTVEQTRFIFTAFSEAAAVLRLSGEETAGVFRALEQIMSKGKVQAEELRGQLGDRLSGSFTLFAKALGITNAELDKFLEKGAISSDQIIGLAAQAQKEFGPGLSAAINGTQSNIERMNNALFDFKNELFEGDFGAEFTKLTKDFTKFLKSSDGKDFAKSLSRAFADVAIGLGNLIRDFDKIKPAITGVASAAGVLARNLDLVLVTFIAIQTSRAVLFFLQVRTAMLGAAAASATLGTTSTAAAGGVTLLSRAVTGFGTVLRVLTGPIGLVLLALGLLVKEFTDYGTAVKAAKKPTEEMQKALADLEDARGTDEEAKARQRVVDLGNEARARLDAAKATVAQARANLELTKAAGANPLARGDMGGRAAESSANLMMETNLAEAESRLSQLENDIEAANRARTGAGRGIRGGRGMGADQNPIVEIPEFNPDAGGDDDKAKKAAEKLKEERERLAAQARDAIIDIEKDILAADEENLDARLKLIDVEFNERIAKLEELKAANIAAATDENKAVAEQLGGQIERLRLLQEEEKTRERLEFQSERVQKAEETLNNLIAARDAQLEAIAAKQEVGAITEMQAREQMHEVELAFQEQILANVTTLRDLLNSLPPEVFDKLGGAELLARLDAVEAKTRNIQTESMRLARIYREDIAEGGAEAFVELGKGIAGYLQGVNSLGDAFKAATDSFRNFLADFLIGIGKAIIKQQILNLLQQASQNGGWLGTFASAVAGSMHTGGVVGQDTGRRRNVSPSWFTHAQRFHTGGLPGLKSDEVPAVLQKGEEVIAKGDPRNILNGGANSGVNISITNAVDSASVIEQGAATPAGTRSLVNVVRANKASFRAALGV